MAQPLNASTLAAYLSENPSRYKSAHPGIAPLPDGYLPTEVIGELLGEAVGTIPNPSPQPNIPKPITIADLMQAAPTTLTALNDINLEPIGARQREGDRAGIEWYAHVLHARGDMPEQERDAVSALVSESIPDPTWSETIPEPSPLFSEFGEHLIPLALIDEALGRSSL